MSTLEKTIILLREMPEQSLESLYDFIHSLWVQQKADVTDSTINDDISKSMGGLQILQSFAGTLPADFDYHKELDDMRKEKYARFN